LGDYRYVDCEVAREALSARIDGEREPVPSARLDEHLDQCADCRSWLEAVAVQAVAYLADPASADDLTQETFLRAIKSLPRFTGRSTAKTWLLSIARRVVVDQIRYNTARPRPAHIVDLDDVIGTDGYGSRIENMVEIRILLDGLDPKRREALVLTQVLGLCYSEAAEVCGCPIGTIRSRVARARDDLLRASNYEDRVG
jgi:RNA polymerase sigma-70 factor (ECF subfamily)